MICNCFPCWKIHLSFPWCIRILSIRFHHGNTISPPSPLWTPIELKVCTSQLSTKLLSNCFLCIDCVSSSQMDCSWRAGTRANNSYAPPPTTQHSRNPIILAVWLTDGNPLACGSEYTPSNLREPEEKFGRSILFLCRYTPHLSKTKCIYLNYTSTSLLL